MYNYFVQIPYFLATAVKLFEVCQPSRLVMLLILDVLNCTKCFHYFGTMKLVLILHCARQCLV